MQVGKFFGNVASAVGSSAGWALDNTSKATGWLWDNTTPKQKILGTGLILGAGALASLVGGPLAIIGAGLVTGGATIGVDAVKTSNYKKKAQVNQSTLEAQKNLAEQAKIKRAEDNKNNLEQVMQMAASTGATVAVGADVLDKLNGDGGSSPQPPQQSMPPMPGGPSNTEKAIGYIASSWPFRLAKNVLTVAAVAGLGYLGAKTFAPEATDRAIKKVKGYYSEPHTIVEAKNPRDLSEVVEGRLLDQAHRYRAKKKGHPDVLVLGFNNRSKGRLEADTLLIPEPSEQNRMLKVMSESMIYAESKKGHIEIKRPLDATHTQTEMAPYTENIINPVVPEDKQQFSDIQTLYGENMVTIATYREWQRLSGKKDIVIEALKVIKPR